MKCFRITMSMI